MSLREACGQICHSLLFNPCSLGTLLAIQLLLRLNGASWAQLVNPLSLSLPLWFAGYVAVRIALLGFVDGLCWLVGPRLPQLPSRSGPSPVFQHKMRALDLVFLGLNSLIEFVFAQQVGHLLLDSSLVERSFSSLRLANGPLGVWMLLVADDLLYAPMHRAMHIPMVYPYVHKHHHRNTFPARGYVDAANEHPVEQVLALSLHWLAIHMVAHTTGLHVVALAAHFVIKAMGACFNHTGFDVQFSLFGIEYSVRAHEMHHRKPNTNFAQFVMFWDRLMGTYKPYDSGLKTEADGRQEVKSK